jgi:hypothetical protein
MIITRNEQEDVIKVLYKSSMILSSTYDKETNKLNIIFTNGGNYDYPNVKKTDYLKFEMAESVGKAFIQYIKPYSFIKLENADTNLIKEEINKVKENALKGITQLMIKQMDTMTYFHKEYTNLEEHQVKTLQEIINKYFEIKGN